MKLSRSYCQTTFVSFWKKFIIFIIAIRTFIVRCMFILYASIGIWNVVIEKTNIYWLLLITIIPLFIETFIGIHQIKMNDNSKSTSSKWFSPVVALFLFSACPPIWIMEITICTNKLVTQVPINNHSITTSFIVTQRTINQKEAVISTKMLLLNQTEIVNVSLKTINQTAKTNYTEQSQNLTISGINTFNDTLEYDNNTDISNQENKTSIESKYITDFSTINESTTKFTEQSTSKPEINVEKSTTKNKSLTIVHDNNAIVPIYSMSKFKDVIEKQRVQVIHDIETMWSKYDIQSRVTILEQILLLNLILCRWILPRGGITRDQLSQLLLVNIGMSADILELFEAMKEPFVRHNFILNTIILTLWQMSLIQFSLTKTVTKARKIRMGFAEDYASTTRSESKVQLTNCICCQTELWAIATSLLLQDIPFFCLRMTLIFHFNVLSYSNIFFTSKNTLVILLQLFRSYVILCEAGNKDKGLESAISKQSLASIGVTRWNQLQNNSANDILGTDKGRPLISDRYDMKKNGNDKEDHLAVLPKASPELSIASMGHSRSNSQMSHVHENF